MTYTNEIFPEEVETKKVEEKGGGERNKGHILLLIWREKELPQDTT